MSSIRSAGAVLYSGDAGGGAGPALSGLDGEGDLLRLSLEGEPGPGVSGSCGTVTWGDASREVRVLFCGELALLIDGEGGDLGGSLLDVWWVRRVRG